MTLLNCSNLCLAVAASVFLAAATPVQAAPAQWRVDAKASRVGFNGTYSGAAFNGTFKRWTADIKFDPADLAHSSISATFDTASAATGDKLQETSLAGAEWFDSARQPKATLVSKSIRRVGPDRYEADAVLTIKGKGYPTRLPFTVSITGRTAVAKGQVTLDRVRLDLGMKSDPGAAWVSRNINVSFVISASR